MKNKNLHKTLIFCSIIIFGLISCDKITNNGYNYLIGYFPLSPVNLTEFNTEYDDYNSASPVLGKTFPLCFSSNRNSNGDNYDIVYKLMSVYFSKKTGKLSVYENLQTTSDVYVENENINFALAKINTPFNEYGPYLISNGRNYNSENRNGRYETYIFLYSNNSSGNQDIYFTQNIENENYETPIPISYLNSESDDAYPVFNSDTSKLYFTSNRQGKFDIYNIKTDNSLDIVEILSENNTAPIEKDSILSSEYDDKCPFISNKIMVFASNREGGFGGFDLYYSILENGEWSTPENFGSWINTEYDEYRPIIKSAGPWGFENDMMIFSSNRPGGKGGFDLYYIGIQRM